VAHVTASQTRAYGGLRGWIDNVDRLGELKRVSGAHWDVEMGAITQSPPSPRGDPAQIVAASDRGRMKLGWKPQYDDLATIKLCETMQLYARRICTGRFALHHRYWPEAFLNSG
jgi:hypothetical protein